MQRIAKLVWTGHGAHFYGQMFCTQGPKSPAAGCTRAHPILAPVHVTNRHNELCIVRQLHKQLQNRILLNASSLASQLPGICPLVSCCKMLQCSAFLAETIFSIVGCDLLPVTVWQSAGSTDYSSWNVAAFVCVPFANSKPQFPSCPFLQNSTSHAGMLY